MANTNVEELVNNLMNDHEVIRASLGILDRMLNSGKLNTHDVGKLLDFYEQFVDGCHHVKEEEILFPAINMGLYPFENSPVSIMVMDHGIFRYLT